MLNVCKSVISYIDNKHQYHLSCFYKNECFDESLSTIHNYFNFNKEPTDQQLKNIVGQYFKDNYKNNLLVKHKHQHQEHEHQFPQIESQQYVILKHFYMLSPYFSHSQKTRILA